MTSGTLLPPTKKRVERITLNVTAGFKEDVEQLAESNGHTLTDLVKIAISLLRVVIEERKKGNKLVIVSSEGVPQMQLVIPGL
jgi:hypothetical protein